MIGVTFFGLIFTPVFYVVVRGFAFAPEICGYLTAAGRMSNLTRAQPPDPISDSAKYA